MSTTGFNFVTCLAEYITWSTVNGDVVLRGIIQTYNQRVRLKLHGSILQLTLRNQGFNIISVHSSEKRTEL